MTTLIMAWMSADVGDSDIICTTATSATATNTVKVLVLDCLADVLKEICDIPFGGSIQGWYLSMEVVAEFA